MHRKRARLGFRLNVPPERFPFSDKSLCDSLGRKVVHSDMHRLDPEALGSRTNLLRVSFLRANNQHQSFSIASEDSERPLLVGGQAFAQHEVYDPAKEAWTTAAPLPTARHGLTSQGIEDSFYVIGGGPHPGLSTSDLVDIFALGRDRGD